MSIEEHGIIHSRSQGVVDYAYLYAKKAHEGQVRKYTNEPYISHPVNVARIVSEVTSDIDMISAALLHDTLEDTDATYDDLSYNFGIFTARLVLQVTDFSALTDGNRAFRKELDKRYLERATPQGKTIKLADLIDNTSSIVRYDSDFAKVYMKEKKELLEVLRAGDQTLYKRAKDIVDEYYSKTANT